MALLNVGQIKSRLALGGALLLLLLLLLRELRVFPFHNRKPFAWPGVGVLECSFEEKALTCTTGCEGTQVPPYLQNHCKALGAPLAWFTRIAASWLHNLHDRPVPSPSCGVVLCSPHCPNSCGLELHNARVYSQNGEDGILMWIFLNIATTDKYYVEFGTQVRFRTASTV